ncbi:YlxR family protein [uncultured Jatrophihabitans sp.]|uniref:YlxR family protein n=1 Tax=uncultured Jatrophihabitans sp. TaxID=1610747 RepID=UPI0035CA9757
MSAASPSAASDLACSGPPCPIRTCIGCRQKAPATALLRVVATPDAAGRSAPDVRASGEPAALPVVPDVRHRLPGRGAWLHPDLRCVSLAQRRRAFARALRVPAVDPTPILEYVAQHGAPQQ